MGEALKPRPCPLCGESATLLTDDVSGWRHVECDWCDARGPEKPDGNEAAIAAWNRRPGEQAAAEERTRAIVERLREARWQADLPINGADHFNFAANFIAREFAFPAGEP